jgi:hypothetical protein
MLPLASRHSGSNERAAAVDMRREFKFGICKNGALYVQTMREGEQ